MTGVPQASDCPWHLQGTGKATPYPIHAQLDKTIQQTRQLKRVQHVPPEWHQSTRNTKDERSTKKNR